MNMILVLHIAIALISLIYTGYVYFAPSHNKLRASYTMAALTAASGTWLIISNPTHMAESCLTGITYLAIIFYGIHLANRKLAVIRQEADKRR
jgi:hypothetical protein